MNGGQHWPFSLEEVLELLVVQLEKDNKSITYLDSLNCDLYPKGNKTCLINQVEYQDCLCEYFIIASLRAMQHSWGKRHYYVPFVF